MWITDCGKLVISAGIIVIFSLLIGFYRNNRVLHHVVDDQGVKKVSVGRSSFKCWPNYEDFGKKELICRRRCTNQSFSLAGIDRCFPWLNCQHLKHVELVHQIGQGAVKQVFLGLWRGNYVSVSKPTLVDGEILYEKDFRHGLRMLIELGPQDRVTQLIGFCKNPLTIISEYHRFGSLARFRQVLDTIQLPDPQKNRFQLCVDYVEILQLLHSGPIGTRVMCDSNDLSKTLEQYLLTDDLRLVVNDLDALPRVDRETGKLIRCGHRPLSGPFVAPEQRWPTGVPYDELLMSPYDEKTDVWKIPDVCQTFLYHPEDDIILFRLFSIHKMCKSDDPNDRPSAAHVLRVYKTVWNDIFDE